MVCRFVDSARMRLINDVGIMNGEIVPTDTGDAVPALFKELTLV